MLLSQATSRGEGGAGVSGGGVGPTHGPTHADAQPPHPTHHPAATHSPARATTRRRPSVRFAPGPLPLPPDGHPPSTEARSGPPPRGAAASARRAAWGEPGPAWAEEPLTPAHLRLLAAELGPENEASIIRLKRRCVESEARGAGSPLLSTLPLSILIFSCTNTLSQCRLPAAHPAGPRPPGPAPLQRGGRPGCVAGRQGAGRAGVREKERAERDSFFL